jgi:hypothetical protein
VKELEDAGSVAAKLQVFETAWEKTGGACFLYFAYRANDVEEHHVRAYTQARQLEDLGPAQVPADALSSARIYTGNMRRGDYTCGVEFRFAGEPPPGSRGVVEATFRGIEGDSAQASREVVELATEPVVRQFRVGTWEFRAGPGLEVVSGQQTLLVDSCGREPFRVDVRQLPPPTPTAPPEPANSRSPLGPVEAPVDVGVPQTKRDMRRLGNLGIGVGAGIAVVGGVVLGVGTVQWLSTCNDPVHNYNEARADGTTACRELIEDRTRLRSAGAGLLGAGIGVVVPAAILRDSTRDIRAVWLPIAGGVATAAGIGMIAGGLIQFNRSFGPDSEVPWSQPSTVALHSVGGAFAGLGAGLLTASVVRLAWRKRPESPAQRAALQLASARLLGGAMFVLAGRF